MLNLFRKLFGSSRPNSYLQVSAEAVPTGNQSRSLVLDHCYLQWDTQEQNLKLSEATMQLLGLPEGSTPGMRELKNICHPEDIRQVGRMLDVILFKKKFPDFYCRIITPNHNIKHIFVTGEVVLDSNQNVAAIKALLQDVTEQRMHIQKIHMQSRTLEDIAWLQSHKMRSPVATIMGLIQLFNSDNINDPINIKILEGIKEAAGNLDEIIKEINSKTDTLKVAS